jgi:hypothetical protein
MADNPYAKYVTPSGGTVIRDPYRAAEEERKANEELRRQQDQQFEAQRLAIAQQQAALAAQSGQIAADKAAREGAASDARGGVDTTEAERTAGFLATRLAGGLEDLKRIGMGNAPSLFEATAGQTAIGNYANSEDWQRTLAAQRDILDAALTLGTGAAYTAEQIDGYRKAYFPQPGDTAKTIADKKIRLERVLEGAKIKAGASAGQIDEALARSALFGMQQGMTPAQEARYDQILAQNPNATAEQLQAIFTAENFPTMTNLAEVVAARDAGLGTLPGSAERTIPYQESLVGQGMSGVNEGIAGFLGFPVDALAGGMNAVGGGMNWLNEAMGGDPRANLAPIENPVLGGEWWRDVMAPTIYEPTDNVAAQLLRRTGQSVGGALIPVAGAANTGRQLLGGLTAATGGGLAAGTSQQVAPGNLGAEIASEVLASAVTGGGLASLSQAGRTRAMESAIPTVPELKQEAGELYRRAQASGATAGPAETQALNDTIESILRREGRISPTGRISEVSPQISEAARQSREFAGQPMDPRQMETTRRVLSEGMAAPGASRDDKRIARLLVNEFDDWADPLIPGIQSARETASRYLTAETLEQARELAGARAQQFSGSGFENALRTDYRALDRNLIKGRESFSDPLVEAVENVSRGTPYSNTMRNIGRFAPTDKVGGLAALAPTTLATMVGGPEIGLTVGAGITGATGLARYLATKAGTRNAEIAELIARNGGTLPQAQYITPEEEQILAALIAGQTSQQLEP